MANRRSKRSPKPNRTLTDQLNVRVPTELLRRVSIVAAGKGDTLAKFVSDALDERTRDHRGDVRRIMEREKSPKKWL
jgi:predicted HicB family RNase H-like nuclease